MVDRKDDNQKGGNSRTKRPTDKPGSERVGLGRNEEGKKPVKYSLGVRQPAKPKPPKPKTD